MSYKTILVCFSSEADANRLTPVASQLARQLNAHLIGLYAIQDMQNYASVSMQLSADAITRLQANQQATTHRIKTLFETHTQAEQFVSEWREVETNIAVAGEKLSEQARCADLVIMSQYDADEDNQGSANLLRSVVETSGRPVLVIPRYGQFDTIGKRSLIGWSGTGESARSVHDAIPLMQGGVSADIFWVTGADKSSDRKLEYSGHEMARCLNRHGIDASVSHRVKAGIPIGDELLNEAADSCADLIVTGAYGHSRLYDFVIGATTSHLLSHMTVPVLFAH